MSYVIGIARNRVLHRLAKRQEMDACLCYSKEKQHWMMRNKVLARRRLALEARELAKAKERANGKVKWARNPTDIGDPEPVIQLDPDEDYECVEYRRFAYRARKWKEPRWAVVKAAITNGELNSRFLVTNLAPHELSPRGRAYNSREIYWFYCQRGDQENRIKEWKPDLDGGRTSCHRFEANRFRLIPHTAAMFLLNVGQSKMPVTRRFKNMGKTPCARIFSRWRPASRCRAAASGFISPAAYRKRIERTLAAILAAKGLPNLPVPANLPGTVRWKALFQQATWALTTIEEEMDKTTTSHLVQIRLLL